MNSLTPLQTLALMPSPLGACDPQNEMERHLQQLVYAGLESGAPIEFTSAAEFSRRLRERSAARAAKITPSSTAK